MEQYLLDRIKYYETMEKTRTRDFIEDLKLIWDIYKKLSWWEDDPVLTFLKTKKVKWAHLMKPDKALQLATELGYVKA